MADPYPVLDRLSPDERAQLRDRALRLKNAGLSHLEIAEQLNIPTNRVPEELRAAMRVFIDTPLHEVAAGQMAMLRDVKRAFYTKAMKGDRESATLLMKVMDHEAKLTGIYAPTRVQAVIGGGVSDAEFALVAEQMLLAAGKEVPRHIAAAAQAARAKELEEGRAAG